MSLTQLGIGRIRRARMLRVKRRPSELVPDVLPAWVTAQVGPVDVARSPLDGPVLAAPPTVCSVCGGSDPRWEYRGDGSIRMLSCDDCITSYSGPFDC